ncbi:hypothetical protein PHAVU_007G171466 [Phaseolus vulgaris]
MFFFCCHVCVGQAYPSFYVFYINLCIGLYVGQADAKFDVNFFSSSSAKSTHRHFYTFASVWHTHKPTILCRFYVDMTDDIFVRFSLAWLTQCVSHALTNENVTLLPRVFCLMVGRRKSND